MSFHHQGNLILLFDLFKGGVVLFGLFMTICDYFQSFSLQIVKSNFLDDGWIMGRTMTSQEGGFGTSAQRLGFVNP